MSLQTQPLLRRGMLCQASRLVVLGARAPPKYPLYFPACLRLSIRSPIEVAHFYSSALKPIRHARHFCQLFCYGC